MAPGPHSKIQEIWDEDDKPGQLEASNDSGDRDQPTDAVGPDIADELLGPRNIPLPIIPWAEAGLTKP